jgi:translation initiation factor 3 subunit F
MASDSHEIFMENSLEHLEATSGDMVKWLERVLNYVEEVLAKPEPTAEESEFGRKLMKIVTTAATQIQPEKLDNLVYGSMRDYMMISYLSGLTKTQLSATQFATMHERQ